MLQLLPPQLKLIIYALIFIGISGGSAYITHKIDNSRYLALELSYKEAETKAIQQALDRQKSIDELKNKQAADAINKQRNIVKQTQVRLDEVNKYINNAKYGCIDIATVRLFNSTIQSDPTKQLPIAASRTNAECSGINPTEFARTIIKNIGIAKQNAQQLNDIIRSIQELNKK